MTTAAEIPDTTPSSEVPRKRRGPSLSVQVFIGMGLGIVAGVFFGEIIEPVQIIGQIFISLLQMTVLPYILVSLIAGIGKLSYAEMRLLTIQGGRFVLLFWIIALLFTVLFTLALPSWESATFFSNSLIESKVQADLVKLYIPANPFFSLSNSLVPAIVIFSLAIGLAIIGVPKKGNFIDDLDVIGEAIMRIAGFIARLAPIGVFALIAAAAGTLDIEDLGRLQVYIITYIGAALLLSFWVLPVLIGVLTPIPTRRVLAVSQDALVTAFATGSLLIVLPLLAERMKDLLEEVRMTGREAESAIDLVVPINFNLPNLGKLMALAFVPFAGWFIGSTVSFEQFPLFLVSGLLSFFGEVVVALPFLLDLMHLPADMFELFLAVDVFTGRFGTLLAGVHTVVLALLTAAAVSGQLRLHWAGFVRYLVLSIVLSIGLFAGLRLFYEVVVPQEYRTYDKLVQMDLAVERVESRDIKLDVVTPNTRGSDGSRLTAIRDRGSLRVGYLKDALPFVYHNKSGDIIGLDTDMVHLLAGQLDVRLEFVRVERDQIGHLLNDGYIDIMTSLVVTPERATEVHFTAPHIQSTLGLVVRDYERNRFDSNEELHAIESMKVATINLPYYSKFLKRNLPQVEVVTLQSPRQFFKAEPGEYDALLYIAEAASAWTLIYTDFSVVVPKPRTVSAPVAYSLPRNAPQLIAFVDTWLQLQQEAGVIDELFSYWILGEGAESSEPRWSIIRDVLGWVD
jgi:Na+/H+-dicarboxylate symporter/ABC-type amino acid transport substrate-binding protein